MFVLFATICVYEPPGPPFVVNRSTHCPPFVWFCGEQEILVFPDTPLPITPDCSPETQPGLAAYLAHIHREGWSKCRQALSCTSARSLQCPPQDLHWKLGHYQVHACLPCMSTPPAASSCRPAAVPQRLCTATTLVIATTVHSSHELTHAVLCRPTTSHLNLGQYAVVHVTPLVLTTAEGLLGVWVCLCCSTPPSCA